MAFPTQAVVALPILFIIVILVAERASERAHRTIIALTACTRPLRIKKSPTILIP